MDEEIIKRVLEALFEWRIDTAREEGITLNRVLGNETLELIARTGPINLDELQNIRGIGPGKTRKWGEEILAVIHRNGGQRSVHIVLGKETSYVTESDWYRDKDKPVNLSSELMPYVEFADRFFCPVRQQALAEGRRIKADRGMSLQEELKKELTFKDGFQIGPLMRQGLDEVRPETIEDLYTMDYQHTDMNPIVIEKYGKLILTIVARHEREKPAEPKGNTPSVRPSRIRTGLDLLILKEKRQEIRAKIPFSVGAYSAGEYDPQYEQTLNKAISFVESCLYLEDAEGKPFTPWAIAQKMKAIGLPLPTEYSYLGDGESCPSYWEDADKYKHLVQMRHRERADE